MVQFQNAFIVARVGNPVFALADKTEEVFRGGHDLRLKTLTVGLDHPVADMAADYLAAVIGTG